MKKKKNIEYKKGYNKGYLAGLKKGKEKILSGVGYQLKMQS